MATRASLHYCTPKQEAYLRVLNRQAFALRCIPYTVDWSRSILRTEASQMIADFKAAIAKAKGEGVRT